MGTTSIRHIIESTIVAYLQAETTFTGTNIYPADSTADAVLPKIVVTCESAATPSSLPDGLGNYDCTVRLVTYDNANDVSLAAHRAKTAALAAMMSDVTAIQAAFTAGLEAYVYDTMLISEDQGLEESSNSWATILNVRVVCVLSA